LDAVEKNVKTILPTLNANSRLLAQSVGLESKTLEFAENESIFQYDDKFKIFANFIDKCSEKLRGNYNAVKRKMETSISELEIKDIEITNLESLTNQYDEITKKNWEKNY